MSLPVNQIILGDCVEVLKSFPENSIDCVVTDPPYGLSAISGQQITEKVNRVILQILFPNLNNFDTKFLEEIYFSGISLDGSFLSYMKALGVIYSRIGVPPSSINFDDLIGAREIKINNCPKTPITIPEGFLSLKTDSQGCKCLGDYILDFGIGFWESTRSDLFSGDLTQFSSGEIRLPCCPVLNPSSPDFLTDLLVIWGINNFIGIYNNSLGQSQTTPTILARRRTIDSFMLTFDLRRRTIEFTSTNGTNELSTNEVFSCPQLIRAFPRTGGLSTPLNSLRISIIDPVTNRASPFYFNLLCHIDDNTINPNLYFMDKILDVYPKGGFMGKSWDSTIPPIQSFREIYRVMKPGALAFVMCSPRQDLMWRMGQLLEESGFELRQSFISYIYATGFPKSLDVSKGIDKKFGVTPKQVDVGLSGSPKSHSSYNMGNDIKNDGYEFGGKYPITEPITDLAKQWSGWKSQTGLKPALEVIFMVNKPFSEKTIVDNVLKWGVGAINVDETRIPISQEDDIHAKNPHTIHQEDATYEAYHKRGEYTYKVPEGRFPANLIVSDDALNDGKPQNKGHVPHFDGPKNVYGKFNGIENIESYLDDIGSFSRYFDLDAWAEHHGFLNVPKASTSEREIGLENEEKKDFLKDYGSWGNHKIFSNKYTEESANPSNRGITPKRANIHPTVKPKKLMAFLIELGCPSRGIVLDPFVGSGTTCMAAKELGRNYIGIEIVPEYVEIARKRISGGGENLEMWFE